jgi:transmembrane sensor
MTGRIDDGGPDALRDEAVAWLVRVQSDAATAEDWAALGRWLDGSEARQAAFDKVELLSQEIEGVSPQIAAAIERPATQVLPFRRPALRRRAWPAWGTAAAAAAAVLTLGPVLWRSYEGVETVYRTAPGATRQVTLADGTHIRMDAASTLKVRLGWRTRQVELGDAEASFDVAKDSQRPFVISAGDQQVRVVGTAFNISHYDARFILTVSRGIVEVRLPDRGPDPVARLVAGDELRRQDGAPQFTRSQVDPQASLAWTGGRLVSDNRPLPEIVAYLNRRYAIPLRLTPAAESLRFSGVLELGDQATLARRLGEYLGIPVHRTAGQFTLG